MTSLGGGTPPSANEPPPADGPNVQVPPVLHVHMGPEQLQSPEQPAAKVEEVLPPQLTGRAAPTTTMNVTPRDTDQTDCDTFNLFGPSSQKGPGQRPSHGCRTRNVTSNSHAHRSGWGSLLGIVGASRTKPGRETGNLVTLVASGLLALLVGGGCRCGAQRARPSHCRAQGRRFLVFRICAGLVRAGA
jgi:hypothetical protein